MQNGHTADSFDGGRGACEPEQYGTTELGWLVRARHEPDDDDARALALAIIALTGAD